jgi:hypothetical protein
MACVGSQQACNHVAMRSGVPTTEYRVPSTEYPEQREVSPAATAAAEVVEMRLLFGTAEGVVEPGYAFFSARESGHFLRANADSDVGARAVSGCRDVGARRQVCTRNRAFCKLLARSIRQGTSRFARPGSEIRVLALSASGKVPASRVGARSRVFKTQYESDP